MRRQSASVHRDRVAQDRERPPANAGERTFGISMVSTRVFSECRLATERFATPCDKALVRTSSRVDPPVACQ